MQNRNLAARVIGLLVFALGIGILITSFVFAFQLFTSPTAALAIKTASGGSSATNNLSQTALSVLVKIGALYIMVLAGSHITSRGVQMYFASEHPLRLRSMDEGNE